MSSIEVNDRKKKKEKRNSIWIVFCTEAEHDLLLLHAGTSFRLAKLLSVVVKSLKQTLAILPKAAAKLIRSLL